MERALRCEAPRFYFLGSLPAETRHEYPDFAEVTFMQRVRFISGWESYHLTLTGITPLDSCRPTIIRLHPGVDLEEFPV